MHREIGLVAASYLRVYSKALGRPTRQCGDRILCLWISDHGRQRVEESSPKRAASALAWQNQVELQAQMSCSTIRYVSWTLCRTAKRAIPGLTRSLRLICSTRVCSISLGRHETAAFLLGFTELELERCSVSVSSRKPKRKARGKSSGWLHYGEPIVRYRRPLCWIGNGGDPRCRTLRLSLKYSTDSGSSVSGGTICDDRMPRGRPTHCVPCDTRYSAMLRADHESCNHRSVRRRARRCWLRDPALRLCFLKLTALAVALRLGCSCSCSCS